MSSLGLVNKATNDCAEELLNVFENNKSVSKSTLREIIQRHADAEETAFIDTEDREFLAEMFGLIAEACRISKEESSNAGLELTKMMKNLFRV